MDKTSFDIGFWSGCLAGAGAILLFLYLFVDKVGCYGPTGRACIIGLKFGIPFITY